MSKLDEKIAQYIEVSKTLGLGLDEALIISVTKGLGPSIYNKDSETVSCSADTELDTVKKNFLENKLGLTDTDANNAAVKKVCEAMGSSNKQKYRALFYALLVKEFGKESVYA